MKKSIIALVIAGLPLAASAEVILYQKQRDRRSGQNQR